MNEKNMENFLNPDQVQKFMSNNMEKQLIKNKINQTNSICNTNTLPPPATTPPTHTATSEPPSNIPTQALPTNIVDDPLPPPAEATPPPPNTTNHSSQTEPWEGPPPTTNSIDEQANFSAIPLQIKTLLNNEKKRNKKMISRILIAKSKLKKHGKCFKQERTSHFSIENP
jgi:hypothetical protein